MDQVLISQEKNYLVLRIPIKAVKGENFSVSAKEKAEIERGLRDCKRGRHSKVFNSAKEAVEFLRGL